MASSHKPTDEQRAAVEAFQRRKDLKIAAFAGAGKTSTLELLAQTRSERGLYLAFNRSIADEAKGRFPRTLDCRTTHSLAFGAVRSSYRLNKLTRSVSPKQLAALVGYEDIEFSSALKLAPDHLASLALRTVTQFCQSADDVVLNQHVPKTGRLLGASDAVASDVKAWAVKEAQALWSRMTDRADELPMGHDGYLKLWALSKPKLPAHYILLDEAQDTNAVVLGVLGAQDAQRVYVGDRHQQIYEWRGAVNAMEQIPNCEEVALTMSFRFGNVLATEASRVLATLGERRPLVGNPHVSSVIRGIGDADAVLARTNATVILEVLEASNRGRRAAVVGGTKDLQRLLSDVFNLKAGKPGSCPEFFGFRSWEEVIHFAGTEEGENLRTFVQMVETHGERKLWAALKQVEPEEERADVILSTAHKAKGREWNSVRLAEDFASSRLGRDPNAQSEVRLFYVAMTRAKRELIVSSPLLELYATNAWKSKEREAGKPIERSNQAPDVVRNAARPNPIQHRSLESPFGETYSLDSQPISVLSSPAEVEARPSATTRTLTIPMDTMDEIPPRQPDTLLIGPKPPRGKGFLEGLTEAIFGKR